MKHKLSDDIRSIVREFDKKNGSTYVKFLMESENIVSRSSFPIHVTASGFPISFDRTEVLLIHHRSLDRWIQPGGHIEKDELPGDAAIREVREETGLNMRLIDEDCPTSINVHGIPANPKNKEPAHYHFDMRYLGIADGVVKCELKEIIDAGWFSIDVLKSIDMSIYVETLKRRQD